MRRLPASLDPHDTMAADDVISSNRTLVLKCVCAWMCVLVSVCVCILQDDCSWVAVKALISSVSLSALIESNDQRDTECSKLSEPVSVLKIPVLMSVFLWGVPAVPGSSLTTSAFSSSTISQSSHRFDGRPTGMMLKPSTDKLNVHLFYRNIWKPYRLLNFIRFAWVVHGKNNSRPIPAHFSRTGLISFFLLSAVIVKAVYFRQLACCARCVPQSTFCSAVSVPARHLNERAVVRSSSDPWPVYTPFSSQSESLPNFLGRHQSSYSNFTACVKLSSI